MSVLPTKEDFANEVKSDRLRILYQFTVVATIIALMLLLTFGAMQTRNSGLIFVAAGMFILILACWVTHLLLQRNRFNPAAWSFALGVIACAGVWLNTGDVLAREMVPFLFPVVVFISGLLISPLHTFWMALISTVIIVVAPYMAQGVLLTPHQAFAIVLTFLSALLAAQVTGELYQITEWALNNYQRERRTNDELFEKRQALQMSLKRAEALADRLKEINAELEHARRSAEEAKNFRGQFLANMSHELRTPLNAIIGFSETMLQFPIMYDNVSLPSPYEKDLGQIYNSGRQLLHVINDILDLAKVDAGKLEIHMQVVDIQPVIAAVVSTARGLLKGKEVRLEESLPEALPTAWADETRLRQVLLNLYSNACKYTDEGIIRLTVTLKNQEIEFALKDTGIGIDAAAQSKLFQEFQQAHSAGRGARAGSGLGLAISKQLVTMMGGRIWLESEVGQGSTFSFTIQLYTGQDKQNKPDTQSRPNGLGAARTALPIQTGG